VKGLAKNAAVISKCLLLIPSSAFLWLIFHCEIWVISYLRESFDGEPKISNQRRHCEILTEDNFRVPNSTCGKAETFCVNHNITEHRNTLMSSIVTCHVNISKAAYVRVCISGPRTIFRKVNGLFLMLFWRSPPVSAFFSRL